MIMMSITRTLYKNPQWLLLWAFIFSTLALTFGSYAAAVEIAVKGAGSIIAGLLSITSLFTDLAPVVKPFVLLIGFPLAVILFLEGFIKAFVFSGFYTFAIVLCTLHVLIIRIVYFAMYDVLPLRKLSRNPNLQRVVEFILLFVLYPIFGPILMLYDYVIEKLTKHSLRG